MKKIFKISLLIFSCFFLMSCSQVFKNRFNLNRAYNLYEKGKNADDDKALLDVTDTYNDIIIHEKNQTKYKGTPIADSLIEANRKFIVEAEQLIYLLKKYNRKEDKNNMLMFIENISFILENIAKLFKNEIDDFNSKDLKEPIKTDSYIFYRLQNCFDSINSVNASIKDNMNNIF